LVESRLSVEGDVKQPLLGQRIALEGDVTDELRDTSTHLLVQIRQGPDGLGQSGMAGSRELLEELGAVIEEIQAIVEILERRPD
jgi:hypothetical protein